MKKVTILGSTGSIGTQTLDVIRQQSSDFKVSALVAGNNRNLLENQIKEFSPKYVSVSKEIDYDYLKLRFPDISFGYGEQGILEAACYKSDIVVVAIPGTVALLPTIEAIKLKRIIAIASKEILVSAGQIVVRLAKEYNVPLVPVDSEHSAIMQILQPVINDNGYINYKLDNLKAITLTASGGAFRDEPLAELVNKKSTDALKHPTWDMGAKVTIDSATMMNKGLEVIEAHHLFGIDYDRIKTIIHPQSYVHGFVEFIDGAILPQMGPSDMRIPISYALNYQNPHINLSGIKSQSLLSFSQLSFREMDFARYPALKLAYEVGIHGGSLPAVMNAANEAAVSLFLKDKIKFLEITRLVEKVLEKHDVVKDPTLEQIIEIDNWSKQELYELAQIKNRVVSRSKIG